MDISLTVTEDNIETLTAKGIACQVEDQLCCRVIYSISNADPKVGIMTDDVQIHSIIHNGVDVSELVQSGYASVHELVREYVADTKASMAEDAADSRRDAARWD